MSFQESNKPSEFCWQNIIKPAELCVETAQVYPGAPMVAHLFSVISEKRCFLRSVLDYAAEYRKAV